MAGASAEVSRVSVRVLPDLTGFRDKLRTDLERATRGLTADIRTRVDSTGLRDELQAAANAASAGVRAQIGVSVDRSALSRLTQGLRSGPIKALTGLFGLLSKSVAGLAGAGGAIEVIAGLTAALTQLAPIALALPGVLLGIGAAFATIKIGMQGFGEALKSGDLSKLAPSAREAATAIRGFRTEWSSLQQATQQALFKDTAEPIKRLGQTYLPILRTGMTGVAAEANLMGRNLINALTAPEVSGSVATIFENTRKSMEAARGSLGNLTAGFIKLGGIGSQYLPAMGAAFDGMAARFNDWVNAGMADGSIKAMIDNAIQGFRDLGAIIGNVGSIVGSVFSGISAGMGGASPLSALVETTQMIADTVASPAIQSALNALGQTMAIAGEAVREILGAALTALAPILQAVMPLIQTFAQALSGALVPILQTLGPPIATLVGALSGALQPILTALVPLFVGLAQAIVPIAAALAPVVTMIGQALAPVLAMLVPIVTDLAMQLGTFIAEALTTLAPLFPPLIQAVGAILAAVLPLLQPLLSLGQIIFPIIAGVITILVPLLESLASIFTNIVGPAISFLAPIVSGVFEFIGAIISGAVGFISGVLGWFAGLPGMFADWLGGAARAVGTGIAKVGQFFRDLPKNILSWLGNLGSLLSNAGRDLLSGMWNGIQGLAGWFKDKIFGFFGNILPGWVKNILGIASPSKVFAALGKWVPRGFADGIRASTSDVFDAMGSLVSGATDIANGFNMDAQLAGMDGSFSSNLSGYVEHAVTNNDAFGIDYDRLADAVAARPVLMDGKLVAEGVRKDTLRKAWRR